MDVVRVLESQLLAKIPTCCLCGLPITSVKAYAAFTCLHVVCFPCTNQDFRDSCMQCKNAPLVLDLDYERLEELRQRLITTLEMRPKSDFTVYAEAYDVFYQLILLLTKRDKPVEPSAVIPAPISVPRSMPIPPPKEEWKEEQTCSMCGQDPCECVFVTDSQELWDCWECGYLYNYRGSLECEMCGRVRRKAGSKRRVRPRGRRR